MIFRKVIFRDFKNFILGKRFLRFSSWKKCIRYVKWVINEKVSEFKLKTIRRSYIKYFNFKKWNNFQLKTSPPESIGWEPCWHGYWRMQKVVSDKHREWAQRIYSGLTPEIWTVC